MSIDLLLHPAVPLVFGLSFVMVTFVRSMISARQLGKSPFVIDRRDPILGFVGAVFAIVVLGLVVYFGLIMILPEAEVALGRVPRGHEEGWRLASVVVMTASLFWMTIAQSMMGRSWRVGVDQAETLELRTEGLFAVSRNPVFAGMLGLALGLTLWSPTTVTLAALTASYMALEVQIRGEEIYLERTIGEPYRLYKAKTPRWL